VDVTWAVSRYHKSNDGRFNPLSVAKVRRWAIYTVSRCSGLNYKWALIEEDMEQHDTFFIGHPAFITPLNVLGMLIRRFDDALMCPEEVCHDIQAR
jgi:hypothetical protein